MHKHQIVFKMVAGPAVHGSQFTLFTKSLRNTNISKCLSDSLQCLPHRTCPAALNRRSTIGSVELALIKAFITCGYDVRHSTEVGALLR